MNPKASTHLRPVRNDVPLEERGDDELMLLVASGLRDAFATLVRRHHRHLRAYCARMSGSAALGDDLAQEILLTIWQARGSYEPRGRFRSYLFTIAHRRCFNELRHRAGDDAPTADLPETPVESNQFDELVAGERRRRVHAYMHKLPADQRRALLLRYVAELEYDEIAEIVARSEATVRTRVFLGLARLRKWMTKGQPR
ncbi:MAG TPA: RNA polymerase sigma factor [Polyangiaceae bacterium]